MLRLLMSNIDWHSDKKSAPWFWGSVNRYLSKILPEDLDITPSDTNLNESSHPLTNKYTGTDLALLEAIDM